MGSNRYRVGVVGLGSMGMGAARSCVAAGLATYGIDLNPAVRDALQQAGGEATGADASLFAGDLDAVLLLVVNAEQCRSVLLGPEGLAAKLRPGTGVMLSATISAADSRAIAGELEPLGLLVLDAPVSGGPVKAAAGEMTVMAAGSRAAFDRLRPVLDAVAGRVYEIGEEIGLGATVKIIHQLLAGVHIAVGAEAMAMAARAGVPLETMYQVVTNAAGNSWMFENRMRHVVEGDYAPRSAVDIFVKDLRLVTEAALSLNFPVPLASTALAMFTNASNAGFGREDDAAVIKTFAGIPLPGVGER
ncbi:L-threonate dehydrogenase [Roseomonas sp. WA12]